MKDPNPYSTHIFQVFPYLTHIIIRSDSSQNLGSISDSDHRVVLGLPGLTLINQTVKVKFLLCLYLTLSLTSTYKDCSPIPLTNMSESTFNRRMPHNFIQHVFNLHFLAMLTKIIFLSRLN